MYVSYDVRSSEPGPSLFPTKSLSWGPIAYFVGILDSLNQMLLKSAQVLGVPSACGGSMLNRR